MLVDSILDHLIITLLGWLIGMIAGMGVGYVIAVFSVRLFPPTFKHRHLFALIPWRTFIAAVFILNLAPMIPLRIFGLGMATGVTSVAYAIFLCAVILTVQIYRISLGGFSVARFRVSWIRSLAVLSVVITAQYGFLGGGGLGLIIHQDILRLNYRDAIAAGLWMAGIALVIDSAVGIIGLLIESRNGYSKNMDGIATSRSLQKSEGAMTSKSQHDIENIYADYYQTAMKISKASARASFPYLVPALIILVVWFMGIPVGAIPEFLLSALAILFGIGFFVAAGVRTNKEIAKVAQAKIGFGEFCQLGFNFGFWRNYWKKEFPTGEKLEYFLDLIGEAQE